MKEWEEKGNNKINFFLLFFSSPIVIYNKSKLSSDSKKVITKKKRRKKRFYEVFKDFPAIRHGKFERILPKNQTTDPGSHKTEIC